MVSHVVSAHVNAQDIFAHFLAQDGLNLSTIWREGAAAVLKHKDTQVLFCREVTTQQCNMSEFFQVGLHSMEEDTAP